MSGSHTPTDTVVLFDYDDYDDYDFDLDTTISEFFVWFRQCGIAAFNGYYVSDGTLSGDKPVFAHFKNDALKLFFVDDSYNSYTHKSRKPSLGVEASRHSRLATTISAAALREDGSDAVSDFKNRWVLCEMGEVVFCSDVIPATGNRFDADEFSSLPPCIGWQLNAECCRSCDWPMAALTYIAICERGLVQWSPPRIAPRSLLRCATLRQVHSDAEIALQILDVVMQAATGESLGFSLITTKRLEVLAVASDGVAARSGLRAADCITEVNGTVVGDDTHAALCALRSAADGVVTLTVCRRAFGDLLIVVSRAAVHSCNGRYVFERLDESECPVFKKQCEEECADCFQIRRVFLDSETGDSLWALSSSRCGDLYVALSAEMNEPPNGGWTPVSDNGGVAPGPGLVFFNRKRRLVASRSPKPKEPRLQLELSKEVSKRTDAARRRTLLDEVMDLREAYYQSWISGHKWEFALERMAERCAETKRQLFKERKALFFAKGSEEKARDEVTKLTKEMIRTKSRKAKGAFAKGTQSEALDELRLANAQLQTLLDASRMELLETQRENERWQVSHDSVFDTFTTQQRVFAAERLRMEEAENWFKQQWNESKEQLADAQIHVAFCRQKIRELSGDCGLRQFDEELKQKTQKSSSVSLKATKDHSKLGIPSSTRSAASGWVSFDAGTDDLHLQAPAGSQSADEGYDTMVEGSSTETEESMDSVDLANASNPFLDVVDSDSDKDNVSSTDIDEREDEKADAIVGSDAVDGQPHDDYGEGHGDDEVRPSHKLTLFSDDFKQPHAVAADGSEQPVGGQLDHDQDHDADDEEEDDHADDEHGGVHHVQWVVATDGGDEKQEEDAHDSDGFEDDGQEHAHDAGGEEGLEDDEFDAPELDYRQPSNRTMVQHSSDEFSSASSVEAEDDAVADGRHVVADGRHAICVTCDIGVNTELSGAVIAVETAEESTTAVVAAIGSGLCIEKPTARNVMFVGGNAIDGEKSPITRIEIGLVGESDGDDSDSDSSSFEDEDDSVSESECDSGDGSEEQTGDKRVDCIGLFDLDSAEFKLNAEQDNEPKLKAEDTAEDEEEQQQQEEEDMQFLESTPLLGMGLTMSLENIKALSTSREEKERLLQMDVDGDVELTPITEAEDDFMKLPSLVLPATRSGTGVRADFDGHLQETPSCVFFGFKLF